MGMVALAMGPSQGWSARVPPRREGLVQVCACAGSQAQSEKLDWPAAKCPELQQRSCSRRRSISQLQAAAAGLLVAILDVMMWCLLCPALRLCFSICGGCSLLRCRRDVTSRRAQWRWRWRSVGDQAGVHCAADSGRSCCRRWGAGQVLLRLGGHSAVCSGSCQR